MLQAQLKKKTGGGAAGGRGREETEEDVRRESRGGHNEEAAAPSPSQLSSSPRSTAHLAGAARVLPPIGGSDGGWEREKNVHFNYMLKVLEIMLLIWNVIGCNSILKTATLFDSAAPPVLLGWRNWRPRSVWVSTAATLRQAQSEWPGRAEWNQAGVRHNSTSF